MKCEEKIEIIKHDLSLLEKHKSDDFRMVIDGTTYDERTKAGEAFVTVMKAKCEVGNGAMPIGEYCGLQVLGERKNLTETEIRIMGKGGYSTPIGDSALGCITRIENLTGKLPSFLKETEQKLSETQSQLEEARTIVLMPFQFEEKLNDYIARQSDINSKLEFKELFNQSDEIFDENDNPKSEVKDRECDEEEYDNDSVYAEYGVGV